MPDTDITREKVNALVDLVSKGESAFAPEKIRYADLLRLTMLVKERDLKVEELLQKIQLLQTEVDRHISDKTDMVSSIGQILSMQRVSEAIQTARDPDSVLTAFLGLLKTVLEFESYGLYTDHPQLFAGVYEDDFGVADLDSTIESLTEDGIIAWAIRERNPTVMPNMMLGNGVTGANSVVLLPLVGRGMEPGVLVMQTNKLSEDFSAQDIELLSILANHAAIAIENTWLNVQTENTKTFLENLIGSSPNTIIASDENNIITLFNTGAGTLLGFTPEEMIGKNLSEVFEKGEEEVKRFRMIMANDGIVQGANVKLINKSLKSCPVSLTASNFTFDEESSKGYLWLCEDLTERIALEEERMKSEKLGLLYQTAVSVNHEINNPLTVVIGNLKILEMISKKSDDKKIQMIVNSALEAGNRIKEVTQKLSNVTSVETISYGDKVKMLNLHGGGSDE